MYPENSACFFNGGSFFFFEHLAIVNYVEHLLQNFRQYVATSSVVGLSVPLAMFLQQVNFFLSPTPTWPMVLALTGNGSGCIRGFETSTHIGMMVVGWEDVNGTEQLLPNKMTNTMLPWFWKGNYFIYQLLQSLTSISSKYRHDRQKASQRPRNNNDRHNITERKKPWLGSDPVIMAQLAFVVTLIHR